jgi:carbamoyl-phosphate synthase large subunit
MKRDRLNILITAASRRVALIRGFQEALKRLNLAGSVITTDINPLSPGLYISDRYYFAPLTTSSDYLDRLEEVCEKEEIDVIIPTIDDELVLMGEARERFADLGVRIVISPPETSRICNDKWLTYRFFSDRGIPTPKTWLPEDLPSAGELHFPLFLKPRMGRGSVNTYPLRKEKELRFFVEYVKDAIVQEFLEGPEYTLDTFVDFSGTVISVVPRRRLWVRSGVMDKGRTERKEELLSLGARVARELACIGPVNIQVKYHQDKPYVFEVNPRFSGGISLTMHAGADFTEWVCALCAGGSIEPRIGEFTDGLVMMSYEENVFRKLEVEQFDRIRKLID